MTASRERGELPEGWEWRPLGEVLDELQPGFACGVKDVHDGIPHLRMNNISRTGDLDLSLIRRVPRDYKNIERYLLHPGDVLFNNTNSPILVGKTVLFDIREGEWAYSNHLTRLRPSKDILSSEWLALALRNLWLHGYFESICNRWVNQAAVSQEKLKQTEIPLPPLPEQRRIVARIEAFARRVEEARGLRREAVEWVEAIMPAARSSIFGEIANEFPDLPLAEIAEVQLGKMLSPKSKTGRSPFPYLRNANVQWDRIDLFDLAYMDFDEREREKFALRPGDLLVCEGGEIGRAAIWNGEIENCFYQKALHRVRVKNGKAIPRYLLHLIFWANTSGGFFDLTTGSTIAHLTMEKFKSYRVICPPLGEQRRIAANLDSLQAKAEAIRAAQAETQKELDALMPSVLARAFAGEL